MPAAFPSVESVVAVLTGPTNVSLPGHTGSGTTLMANTFAQADRVAWSIAADGIPASGDVIGYSVSYQGTDIGGSGSAVYVGIGDGDTIRHNGTGGVAQWMNSVVSPGATGQAKDEPHDYATAVGGFPSGDIDTNIESPGGTLPALLAGDAWLVFEGADVPSADGSGTTVASVVLRVWYTRTVTVSEPQPSDLVIHIPAHHTAPGDTQIDVHVLDDSGDQVVGTVTVAGGTSGDTVYTAPLTPPAGNGPWAYTLQWLDTGESIGDWWVEGQVPRAVLGASQAPVVDRFWMDPVTPGVHCNLYWADGRPSASYEALDDPIPYPILQLHGAVPETLAFGAEAVKSLVSLSATEPSFADIDNAYLQFDPGRDWWLGVAYKAVADRDGAVVGDAETDHPIASFGDCILRQAPGVIEFVTPALDTVSLDLPPDYIRGGEVTLAAVYSAEGTEQFSQGLHLMLQYGEDLYTVSRDVTIDLGRPQTVSVGRYPSFSAPGNPALSLRGLILKPRPASQDEVTVFLDEGGAFVLKPDSPLQDTSATANALLRAHPRFVKGQNLLGVVGGPGDTYEDLEWTPVFRDFSLKRGYMHIPPTRASFWKFEFTNLAPEHYEVFVPIEREIKVFPTRVVHQYAEVAKGSYAVESADAGVQAHLDIAQVNRYSDAVANLSLASIDEAYSPTEALVMTSPSSSHRAEELGWVWRWQPWHLGQGAPRFIERQTHYYERVKVRHRTKVGYYVGVKEIRPYRVNYLADDDTARYEEHFLDLAHIESLDALEVAPGGGVESLSYSSQAVSKTLGSARPIRAVQFATKQADAVQVLADDEFTAEDFTTHWSSAGDAQVLRLERRRVEVNRGYVAKLYDDYEGLHYSDLEGRYYGTLEGGTPSGSAFGGLRSTSVPASNAGRMYVAAKVTAPENLTSPVRAELVSDVSGTVLARAERTLSAGETATMWAGYTPGAVRNPHSYQYVEDLGTYGDIEASGATYGQLESVAISGDVYARVVQAGATDDVFEVNRLSVFDHPVLWSFSNDGGANWYDALEVRNNPFGVMQFPDPAGVQFKWRLRVFRPGMDVSALYIRPWYGGLLGGRYHHGMAQFGPNTSVADALPPIERDPMWQQFGGPIPRWWYQDLIVEEFALEADVVSIDSQPTTPVVGTYPSESNFPSGTEYPGDEGVAPPPFDEAFPSGGTYPSDTTVPGS